MNDGNTPDPDSVGTAISAEINVVSNFIQELGSLDSAMTIEATATGGDGHFFGNYAFAGTAISAKTTVFNNFLSGGSGNNMITIDATANGSTANDGPGMNRAESGATAIKTMLDISSNFLAGNAGDDTLSLFIHANPNGNNSGGGGTEILIDLTVQNNTLLGGSGNDVLIFNNSALIDPLNNNILNGGNNFDTLIQAIQDGSLDLTPVGVVGVRVASIEK